MKRNFGGLILILLRSALVACSTVSLVQAADVGNLYGGTAADEIAPNNRVVGVLPYSNQWVYDQRQSYLYLSYSRTSVASPQIPAGNYTADLTTSDFSLGGVDYFVGLFHVAPAERRNFLSGLSVWARYGLSGGIRRGFLYNNNYSIDSASESVYLMAVFMRAGLHVTYDSISWIQPYFGMEISPFAYRQSSSLDSADFQGGGALYGPVAGLHLPLFFEHRASIFGEVRRNLVLSDERNLFGASTSLTAGLGYVF